MIGIERAKELLRTEPSSVAVTILPSLYSHYQNATDCYVSFKVQRKENAQQGTSLYNSEAQSEFQNFLSKLSEESAEVWKHAIRATGRRGVRRLILEQIQDGKGTLSRRGDDGVWPLRLSEMENHRISNAGLLRIEGPPGSDGMASLYTVMQHEPHTETSAT